MKLTKANYETVKGCQTLKEALEKVDLTPEELAGDKMISVGIGRDWHGDWHAVGHEGDFTDCYIEDLQDLSWYEKGWIETPDADYEYNFTDQEELEYWLEKRKGDRDDHYYYGFNETFEGVYYSIADIKRTSEEWGPCSEKCPCTIYEWA